MSGISGLDSPADGRSFATLDIDRDGWLDFVIVNANKPRTLLLRNRLGDARQSRDRTGSFAIRLVGGQRGAQPSSEWSNRDGYGAIVEVALDNRVLMREHRAGEGLAAQNSATILIGLDGRARADEIRIRWPSGRVQSVPGAGDGELLTIYENPAQSPTGTVVASAKYVRSTGSSLVEAPPAGKPDRPKIALSSKLIAGKQSQLYMYTTMATWCLPCVKEIPQLHEVRSAFKSNELAMFAVPYDEKETKDQLKDWMNANRPPYELILDAPRPEVDFLVRVAKEELEVDGLPATLVTNSDGKVLFIRWGPPTVSDLRKLLRNPDEPRIAGDEIEKDDGVAQKPPRKLQAQTADPA